MVPLVSLGKAAIPGKGLNLQSTVTNSARRHSHNQAAAIEGCVSASSEAHLGSLIDQLVERRVNVVGKLDLGDGSHALESDADCKAHDALLRKRSVEYPFGAEIRSEVHAAAEHSSESHVFAEQKNSVVIGKSVPKRPVHCLEKVQASALGLPDLLGELEVRRQRRRGVIEQRSRGKVRGDIEAGLLRSRGVTAEELVWQEEAAGWASLGQWRQTPDGPHNCCTPRNFRLFWEEFTVVRG